MYIISKLKPDIAIDLLKDAVENRGRKIENLMDTVFRQDKKIDLLLEIANDFIGFLEEDCRPNLVKFYQNKLKEIDG